MPDPTQANLIADVDIWVLATPAARHLGTDRHNLPDLAERGLITSRKLPGRRTRYLLSDVLRLAAESTSTRLGPGPREGAPAAAAC